MLGYLAEFLKGFQVPQDKGKVFKPPGPCMNTNKEENRRMRERITVAIAEDEEDEQQRRDVKNGLYGDVL